MAHRHFKTGSGVFTCTVCKRRTRMTTQCIEAEYCGPCEELFGIQNALFDDGAERFVAEGGLKWRDEQVAKIVAGKGDLNAVKAMMPRLFAVGQ